jgi:hypothetical protein
MADVHRIIDSVIAAHGGAALWRSLAAVEAVLSVDGFLFATKRRAPLERMRVRADTAAMHFTFHDYPRPGFRGEWDGAREVRIVDASGMVVARREQPRAAFRGLHRQFYWDDLDFLYFAGYATWNYLTTPFIFLRPGFQFELLPATLPEVVRLRVTFPSDIVTHSRSQIFHFAQNGHLLRLDYTAEVVGGWARAAHLCEHYRNFDGLWMPMHRRVYPLFGRKDPLPWPTLVAIDIHELQLVRIK